MKTATHLIQQDAAPQQETPTLTTGTYGLRLAHDADEAQFRAAARHCISLGLVPAQVVFADPKDPVLFPPPPAPGKIDPITVPRAYAELLRDAVCHSAGDRFALLYDVLWRIQRGERNLVENAADPKIARLGDYGRAVRRDIHKMHAFLRFRPREVEGRTLHVAWFEPLHHVLRRAVPFFANRFTDMDWLIATPAGTALWSDKALVFGPPAERPETVTDEILDGLWPRYYRATFNPARLRLTTMQREMPRHYWSNLPEAAQISSLAAEAQTRVVAMRRKAPDEPQLFAGRIAAQIAAQSPTAVPTIADLPLERLRGEAASCRRCALCGPATQTVFGEGPSDASIVLVGEQPGDHEDLAGRPFVGPAGRLLDAALAEAGLDRSSLYLTNAVKHFKYEPRGKKRIHKRPGASEIAACRWWLDRELASIKPRLVVALGATAASGLAGRTVSIASTRGEAVFGEQRGYVTVHPSYLLRLPDEARRQAERARFVEDLRRIRALGEATQATA